MKTIQKSAKAVVFGVLLFGLLSTARAAVIFSENFEEASLGGVYTPPGTDTTGISPSVGAWGYTIDDDGAIVNGTAIGTGQALAGYDNVSGKLLTVKAYPDQIINSERLQISADFVFTGTMGNTGPLQLSLRTQTNNTAFILVSAYADAAHDATGVNVVFNNSTTSTDADWTKYTPVSNGTAINISMDVNIDTSKYDFKMTRLSDDSVLANYTNLDFLNGTDLTSPTSGFATMQMQFGFSDFATTAGGGGAAAIVDNISIGAVPEPRTVLLMGLSGVFIMVLRRRRTVTS